MAALDDFMTQWGSDAGNNPDAWAAGTTYEDVGMNPSGSIWGDVSGFLTGVGSTIGGLFDIAGDIKGAQQEYQNIGQPDPALLYQQQMMTYALIGGAVLIAILLLKD